MKSHALHPSRWFFMAIACYAWRSKRLAHGSSHCQSCPKSWRSMGSSMPVGVGLPGRRLHEAKLQELDAMLRMMSKLAKAADAPCQRDPFSPEDSQGEPEVPSSRYESWVLMTPFSELLSLITSLQKALEALRLVYRISLLNKFFPCTCSKLEMMLSQRSTPLIVNPIDHDYFV